MAWPFSRLLDFIDNSTPYISADFLNRVQDAVIDINNNGLFKAVNAAISAAYTVTGSWIFQKVLRLDGEAGDGNAILDSECAVTTRRLLWKIRLGTGSGGGSVYARLYAVFTDGTGSAGGLEFTVNAGWNTNTNKWDLDRTQPYAVKLALRPAVSGNAAPALAFYRYNDTTSFADTAWHDQLTLDPSFNAVAQNTLALTPQGVTSPGSLDMAAGVYVKIAGAGDTCGAYQHFRKAFPATPSSVTTLSTDFTANVDAGPFWTILTQSGVLMTVQGTNAGYTHLGQQVRVS